MSVSLKDFLTVLAVIAVIVVVTATSYAIGYALTPVPTPQSSAETTEVENEVETTTETTTEIEVFEETTTTGKNEEYADLVVEISTANSAKPVKTAMFPTATAAETTTKATTTTTTAPATVKQEATSAPVTTTKVETTKVVTTTVAESKKQNGDGSVQIADSEYDYLCRLVYGEAGSEPYKGQVLVAQCLYNAMVKYRCDAWTAAKKYKYTGSTRKGTSDSVKKAVTAVFYDGYRETNEFITMFYAPKYTKGGWSSDHESQIFVCEVGGHRFFKER